MHELLHGKMGKKRILAYIIPLILLTECEHTDPNLVIEEVPELDIQLDLVGSIEDELSNIVFHPTDNSILYAIGTNGTVHLIRKEDGIPEPILNTRDFRFVQRLIDMAFHPDFESNGILLFSYSYWLADTTTASGISKVQVDPATMTGGPVSVVFEQLIMNWDQFTRYDHTVDALEFGPNDGYLYVSTGDGGCCADPFNEAQNLDSFRGKILRIDIDDSPQGYSVPPDNPYVGVAGARDEIWASGLRNPFTMRFDDVTGDLYIFDVGENTWEEINYQPASSTGGENYGWKIFEGNNCLDNANCDASGIDEVPPIFELQHGTANSFIGGVYYRGSAIPELQNRLIFGDFIFNRIWAINYSPTMQRVVSVWELSESLGSEDEGFDGEEGIVSFRQDLDAEIYMADFSGAIFKIVPSN